MLTPLIYISFVADKAPSTRLRRHLRISHPPLVEQRAAPGISQVETCKNSPLTGGPSATQASEQKKWTTAVRAENQWWEKKLNEH